MISVLWASSSSSAVDDLSRQPVSNTLFLQQTENIKFKFLCEKNTHQKQENKKKKKFSF
jgi:hypothetical protein